MNTSVAERNRADRRSSQSRGGSTGTRKSIRDTQFPWTRMLLQQVPPAVLNGVGTTEVTNQKE